MLASHLTMQFASSSDSPAAHSAQGRVQFFADLAYPPMFSTGEGLPPLRYMRPSNENDEFAGLPIVGFTAFNFINANAEPNVLANYSLAVPFRTSVKCYVSDTPGSVAPMCD
jgi:hypothetical protein